MRSDLAALVLLLAAGAPALGTPVSPEAGVRFFENRIRPMLAGHCYECHSTATGEAKGGLSLDSRAGILSGGEGGPVVVPGDPVGSRLLQAVRHLDPDLAMPPKAPPLAHGLVSEIEAWIRMGAPVPEDPVTPGELSLAPGSRTGKSYWSYRPPQASPPPLVHRKGWTRQPVDAFILTRLEEAGVAPSPDALPEVWLRRLKFALVGLPPTLEESADFVRRVRQAGGMAGVDVEPVLAATVDRLLASPQFGERWGRHWLDVARFAESNGRESNLAFPHAWRYRDYVIDAVSADVPFDRFLTEQVAGDLLPARDEQERARLLIATGFLALGAKGLNEMNPAQFAADLVDEQVDVVTRAFLGSSVACARCHDHKTDPFSMRDYYALAGVFQSTQTFYGTWIDSENNNGSRLIQLPQLKGQIVPNRSLAPAEVAKLKADLAQLNAEEKAQNERVQQAMKEGRDLSAEGFQLLQNAIRIYWTRGGIEGRFQTVDEQGKALPLCMGVLDREATEISEARLLERGDLRHPKDVVPRGFPVALAWPDSPQPQRNQSGRRELAAWMTDRRHPLTARVAVNRVWHHVFGMGLVRTVDNFGTTGEAPSHPALLDDLASRFVDQGWSTKRLVRELVLSRTFRQASGLRPGPHRLDPDNRLLWRVTPRRLEAEAIRDAMLSVSGNLDPGRRRASLVAEMDGQSVALVAFNAKLPADLDGSRHRSVYLPVFRDHLPEVLHHFDVAEPTLVTGARDVTNTSLQALYMMNSPFVQDQSRAFSQRLLSRTGSDDERIRLAFRLCFNREPDSTELSLCREYLGPPATPEAWVLFCQGLLSSAEFRLLD